MSSPTALTVPAVAKHTATVIMAHGLGDSGGGWISLAQNWRRRDKFKEVKFIFPNAPSIPITVNFGMSMPGWFDIMAFDDLTAGQDEPGILKSRDYFNCLIDAEIQSGIPSNRIVLGGFSQGGAMAVFNGITSTHKLGGIFGLSSYLLLHNKLKEFMPKDCANKDTPIFLGHGEVDPLVKPVWARMSREILTKEGFNVDLKVYPGLPHSADPDEIDDVETYLNKRIPPLAQGSTAGASAATSSSG